MSRAADNERPLASVGLGLRAVKGGAAVVGVAVEGGVPRVVLSKFLATGTAGDRISLEPYAVAAEFARGPDGEPSAEAARAVAEGRRRQDELAARALRETLRFLEDARCKAVVAALLVNRAGWIADLLTYSAAWPEHVPVAEGLAVREALRFACTECGLGLVEYDERSLPDLAAPAFDVSPVAIEGRLKALGANAGKPWRKEQKLACLSAWFALSQHSFDPNARSV